MKNGRPGNRRRGGRVVRGMTTATAYPATTPDALIAALRPLLTAEAAAEAHAPAGLDAADLEQAVWLRLLERLAGGWSPPRDPARWVRWAVRTEAHRCRRAREAPRPVAEPSAAPDQHALDALRRHALRAAVRALPGRCPALVTAFLSPRDLTYREIAGELGISQGSLGPERSRCLGCLRRMLTAEVAVPDLRGKD